MPRGTHPAPATYDESPLPLLEPVVAGPAPMVLIMIAPHSNTQGHLKRQGLLITRPGGYRHAWGHSLRSWLKRAQTWVLPLLGVKVGCLGFHEFTLYWKWKVKVKMLVTQLSPRTAAHQAPLSMEFSRHEYWSGLPFPSPGDLPDPRITPRSPALQARILYHLSHQGNLTLNWRI